MHVPNLHRVRKKVRDGTLFYDRQPIFIHTLFIQVHHIIQRTHVDHDYQCPAARVPSTVIYYLCLMVMPGGCEVQVKTANSG